MDAGSSCYAVAAARFAVSVSFVIKLMRRWRRTGSIELDRYGGWKRSTVLIHVGRVRALLEAEAPLIDLGVFPDEVRRLLPGDARRPVRS